MGFVHCNSQVAQEREPFNPVNKINVCDLYPFTQLNLCAKRNAGFDIISHQSGTIIREMNHTALFLYLTEQSFSSIIIFHAPVHFYITLAVLSSVQH